MTAFENYVRAQVSDFLQTVLLIDDEAFRRAPLASTGTGDDWDAEDQPESASGRVFELQAPTPVPLEDELDVHEVTFRFADAGLACSILSPQSDSENREFKPAFVKLARRSDVLILDWNMNGDHGATAERLVHEVLRHDGGPVRRRLRLVAVYTGEPDLSQIAERVHLVTDASLEHDPTAWDDERHLAFSRGPVRVAVFAKEHVRNLADSFADRRRDAASLPETVVEEFSRHAGGLVTTAAISALAGIRNDAHRVLASLSPEMDAAVLGQRVNLQRPEDVERQIESLIVRELRAIVEDHEVGSHLDLAHIRRWLNHQKDLPAHGMSKHDFVSKEIRLSLLSGGYSEELVERLNAGGVSKGRIHSLRDTSGTELFVRSAGEQRTSDDLFASRMSVRSRYSKPTPVLRPGTIVEYSGSYKVCVQPACDSVRVGEVRAFPMLPLEVVPHANGKPGDGMFTVPDSKLGGFLRLRVNAKPAGLMMEEFESTGGGVVSARSRGGVLKFRSRRGRHWRWVADLQEDQAQRVIERLSAEFSRIGLEEAEVLRNGY